MEKRISIVIPNYNGADTIGECLTAAFASKYNEFEVVVVDDCSGDNSVEIIRKFPCKLVCIEKRSGTSKARNIGAQNSTGDVIFFTDADCLVQEDTLSIINKTLSETDSSTIIGGTYARMPYDKGFFNTFQSVFVNYSETKNIENPDYIAAHAMVIDARTFRESGGFPEDFLPIIEDVEFSHRMRRSGCTLVMNPGIQVRHIFNFTMVRSLRNAFKKTAYWNIYSLKNRDVFVDSGSASVELKTNVGSYCLNLFLLVLWGVMHKNLFLFLVACALVINIFINRRLFKAFFETKGSLFAGQAILYYMALYPLPISMGTVAAIIKHLYKR
jgi:glycosyltransferase involved in cell wall biosynthesis